MPARTDFAPGEFCWIDLNAHDLQAAARWYSDLFGWSLVMQDTHGGPPYGFLTKGDAVVGGIGQMSDEMKAQGVPPIWNSYVATDDCAATEAKARELGANVIVPTMEIPGFGKLAYFVDPEGAIIATWQSAATDGGKVLQQEPGSASWFELMTRTADASKTFYSGLFGWDFTNLPMEGLEYALVKNGGKDVGGLMPMTDARFDGVPPHWMLYFATEDCDAATKKVAATGGKVIVPSTRIPIGTFAVVQDPQGGTFSLVQSSGTAC